MPENHLLAGLAAHFGTKELQKLTSAKVGIAGVGGLGSNAAIMLCRSGVGNLILVDYDNVEASNLNRQHYWPKHIGMPKTGALANLLLELNPAVKLDVRPLRLNAANIAACLASCDLWLEALDNPEAKTLLVEEALLAGCKVVSASGICGYGGPPLEKRKMGNLVLVGDFSTSSEMAPPLAPRVNQAAALMADAVLEIILDKAVN